jgi:hypothetical protein
MLKAEQKQNSVCIKTLNGHQVAVLLSFRKLSLGLH